MEMEMQDWEAVYAVVENKVKQSEADGRDLSCSIDKSDEDNVKIMIDSDDVNLEIVDGEVFINAVPLWREEGYLLNDWKNNAKGIIDEIVDELFSFQDLINEGWEFWVSEKRTSRWSATAHFTKSGNRENVSYELQIDIDIENTFSEPAYDHMFAEFRRTIEKLSD
ncbi:MAG: hypothetical protein K2X29_05440 [Candidatus Obscuribacterales bacterium]|nr:hypothetical protein [Candidatus Obscuribacterales bacterium]